jgi:hypothetical protein
MALGNLQWISLKEKLFSSSGKLLNIGKKGDGCCRRLFLGLADLL